VVDLLNAAYGSDLDDRFVERLGKETILLEREFNRKAGLPDIAELPPFLRTEPLPPNDTVVDILDSDLERFWDEGFWSEA